MVPLGSSSCLIPDPVNARPFPSALTTMALGHSRRRWFGTCSCKPVPRGLPSSDKQLRATWPHGLSHSWRTIADNSSRTLYHPVCPELGSNAEVLHLYEAPRT